MLNMKPHQPECGAAGEAGAGAVEPTPEELLALMEMLQQQGMDMDKVPSDLKTMLDNVKRQKTAPGGKGAAPPDTPTEEITPDPGFVIKTSESKSGGKVFINVCASDRVTAPGGWSNGVMPDEVAAALDKLQSAGGDAGAAAMTPGEVEALRFPLACGPPRMDADRKGTPCTAIDVVFNADVVSAAAAARKLKAMLIEVAIGWVGNKLGGELDPRYKLPKMRYKGEVVAPQRIRADDKRKKLVTELRDVDEEPSFALRTKKAHAAPPLTLGGATTSAARSNAAGPASKSGAAASTTNTGKATLAGGEVGPAAVAQPSTLAVAASTSAYKVEYEGRPVECIRVTVDLPTSSADGRTLGPARNGCVSVEVCNRSLYVRGAPGLPELHVPLLFAASAEGATAICQAGPTGGPQLVVRLPYRSLDEYLADARAQAPLAFGQLSFASKALLELEP